MKAIQLVALAFLGAAGMFAQNAEQVVDPEQFDLEQSELEQSGLGQSGLGQCSAAPSEQDALVSPGEAAPPAVSTPAYVPFSIKQKYLYSISEIFGPNRLVAIAAHAALDQLGVHPLQWGSRPSSLAVRFASHFGDSFLRHNIEFGVRALDHEDPRYFRSGRGHAWARAGYAVYHTFVVHNDRGGWMPAYSLVAEAFGTPYLVRRWRPETFRTATALDAGSIDVGVNMGTNLLREFWPDMRKALPKRLTRNQRLFPPTLD